MTRYVVSQNLPTLVARLLTLAPGCAEAVAVQGEIEHLLMAALQSGGRSAGETLVESLAGPGQKLERVDALPCMWRLVLPPPRVLELWFLPRDAPFLAAVSYRGGKPWGSQAQRKAAERQEAFYRRYEAAGTAPPTAEDRLIVLVGELEADVNNGGFGQYLGNKDAQRVRDAMASLEQIGAKRTCKLLSLAIQEQEYPAALEPLDQQFTERPEDLASLAMVYIARSGKEA